MPTQMDELQIAILKVVGRLQSARIDEYHVADEIEREMFLERSTVIGVTRCLIDNGHLRRDVIYAAFLELTEKGREAING